MLLMTPITRVTSIATGFSVDSGFCRCSSTHLRSFAHEIWHIQEIARHPGQHHCHLYKRPRDFKRRASRAGGLQQTRDTSRRYHENLQNILGRIAAVTAECTACLVRAREARRYKAAARGSETSREGSTTRRGQAG